METTEVQKPHIVIFPYPAQGHIPPMIHLARKLAAQGFIVTLINVDSIHQKLSKKWIHSPGVEIRLEEIPCDYKMPLGMDSACLNQENANAIVEAIHNVLKPAQDLVGRLNPVPCCVVADYFLTWATKLAKALDIPSVTYWPGNAAWSSLHHHLDLLIANGDAFHDVEASEAESLDKVISYIPGVEAFSYRDLPEYMRKKPSQQSQEFFINTADRMRSSDWILANSMAELEPQTFKAMQESLKNFVSIGPLFPLTDIGTPLGVSLRDEEDSALKWLETQAERSVLYISFGSIGLISEAAFEELAAGLEASKQPFLWVIRRDLLMGITQEKYKEFVEQTEKQGIVVSWAPQVQVLAHSSVGGFFTHCGWNSTFEGLSYGVPLLCWPFFADQLLNCKMVVEDWKFGKRFARQGVVLDRSEVEQKISEFMDESVEMQEIRCRVRGFKGSAYKTIQEGGQSHTNLKAFMQAMQTSNR